MEKLGVDVDPSLEKEASGGTKRVCPKCQTTLLPENESNVPRCPRCGTEPFEAP